jgi:NADH dehydrogenase FAD-containing subunit
VNDVRQDIPRVAIIGGGFGGIAAAKALEHAHAEVILIDRHNHHLFQPLLYQVATAALATGAETNYFGKDQWAEHAPGMKTVDEGR